MLSREKVSMMQNKRMMSIARRARSPEGTSVVRSLSLSDGTVLDPLRNVVISNDGAIHNIIELLKSSSLIFIRAPPAAGKSVLCSDLQLHGSPQLNCRKVVVTARDTTKDVEEKIRRAISCDVDVATAASLGVDVQLRHFFETKKENTLVFDRAHLLCPHQSVFELFELIPARRAILFSADWGEFTSTAPRTTAFPQFSTFFWHPPEPDFDSLNHQLSHAEVQLDVASVRFFWLLSAASRGIFISAMQWVKREQEAEEKESPGLTWTLCKSAAKVAAVHRHFFDFLSQCRAVKVQEEFKDTTNIPREFAQLLVNGPGEIEAFDVRQTLITCGFAKPLGRSNKSRPDHEFELHDYTDSSTPLEVPNALMCRYYLDVFRRDHHLQFTVDSNLEGADNDELGRARCASALCRALPRLDFATVSGVVVSPTTGAAGNAPHSAGVAYEDIYTNAVNRELSQILHTKAETVHDVARGTVDTFFNLSEKTYAIEAVVAVSDVVAEHRSRFGDKKKSSSNINCSEADYKCLWIVAQQYLPLSRGDGSGVVVERETEQEIKALVEKTKGDGVEVVGVLASSNHTSYTLYVKPARQQHTSCDDNNNLEKVYGPFHMKVDFVSRKLVWNKATAKLELVSAQSYVSSDLDRKPRAAAAAATSAPLDAEVIVTDGAVTFPVTPSKPTVMHLKKAIKVGLDADYKGSAARIIIKHPDGTKPGDEDQLQANIKYVFEVPMPMR